MSEEGREIKIIGIDKEAIKVSPDKREIWIVPFKLSLKPDQSWERKFSEVQQRDKDAMKRTVKIVNASLEVELSSTDDLQKVLDTIKIEVAETNAQCAEDDQKKIKIRQELEELRQRQTTATQKFKDDSDQLKF